MRLRFAADPGMNLWAEVIIEVEDEVMYEASKILASPAGGLRYRCRAAFDTTKRPYNPIG